LFGIDANSDISGGLIQRITATLSGEINRGFAKTGANRCGDRGGHTKPVVRRTRQKTGLAKGILPGGMTLIADNQVHATPMQFARNP
jgi:hypothetical protein